MKEDTHDRYYCACAVAIVFNTMKRSREEKEYWDRESANEIMERLSDGMEANDRERTIIRDG